MKNLFRILICTCITLYAVIGTILPSAPAPSSTQADQKNEKATLPLSTPCQSVLKVTIPDDNDEPTIKTVPYTPIRKAQFSPQSTHENIIFEIGSLCNAWQKNPTGTNQLKYSHQIYALVIRSAQSQSTEDDKQCFIENGPIYCNLFINACSQWLKKAEKSKSSTFTFNSCDQ